MEHSPKYKKVKTYFDKGLWTEQMVINAIDKWITLDEAKEITGNPDITVDQSQPTPVDQLQNEMTTAYTEGVQQA